jgi:hypothetical protein
MASDIVLNITNENTALVPFVLYVTIKSFMLSVVVLSAVVLNVTGLLYAFIILKTNQKCFSQLMGFLFETQFPLYKGLEYSIDI